MPSVAGRFEEDAGRLWFLPRFPFVPGRRYALLADGVEVSSIALPMADAAATTRVLSIWPTAAVVPVNLLRGYVSFSAPMSEGLSGFHVQLLGADDRPVDGALVAMEPELWDSERQRLTVLLEPGRIKRGLAPHEDAGEALPEGSVVAVRVAAGFLDAEGRALRSGAERRYVVGPPVRERVAPERWRLDVPAVSTREPLIVTFDRPLDRALLGRCINVVDPLAAVVDGRASIGDGEDSWRFTPRLPWRPGGHRLAVDARLEDVSGNSVRRVFDRDLGRREDTPLDVDEVELAFRCR